VIYVDTSRVATIDKKFSRPVEMDAGLLRIFEKTLDMITQRGIRVILVNPPIADILMKANGQNPEEVIRYYRDYAAAHELVEYWDFNPEYSSNYEILYDLIHLNPKGQKLITEELINRLKGLTL
jgi:lysophospholipase L1-like esterase